ncbi:MAG: phosphatase PAP2 family protein [Dehalococcoidia bacterium]|nr:phosphatase PAP2 family protein [Dehalococcoidia bacterium]
MTIRPITQPRRVSRLASPPRGWTRAFVRDWSLTLAVVGVYFLLRGQAGGDIQLALRVSDILIDIEKATFLFWEPTIQQVSLQAHWVQEFANGVYAYMHFPVLLAVGLWLWFRRRSEFIHMRNVMFISMAFGLVFYYLLPAAPPRLLAANGYDLGFVDTVFGGNTSINYAQPAYLLNEYAAIPSFHFGWIALASAVMWANTANSIVRGAAVALSVVMTWAIVASANHFFIDMALGGLVILVSWYVARRMERRRAAVAGAATATAE